MQMLFQADIGKQTPDQVRATFWKAGDDVEADVRGFAEDLFRVAIAHQEQQSLKRLRGQRNGFVAATQ